MLVTNGQPNGVTPVHRQAVVERLHRALLDGELLPRSALSAQTRLSGGILGPVLDDLLARGVVVRTSDNEPRLRGPKTRYALAADSGFVLAIGFGHDRLGVAVTDLAGAFVSGGDLVTPVGEAGWVDQEPTAAIKKAAALARRALGETAATSLHPLVGVGISFPAPLFANGRPYKGFMDKWQPRDVAEEVRDELDIDRAIPIVLANDANLMALREQRQGAAAGEHHVCVVKWGAGIGAGLIIDGQLYRGPRGLAGEIGHIPATSGTGDPAPDETLDLFKVSPPEVRICRRCGEACLESLIGSDGLLRYLRAKRRDFADVALAISAAQDGDKASAHALRRAAHLLGHKLGPIISTLNLQLLVVDSFASPNAFSLIVDGLREGLRHRMTSAAFEQLTLRPAACGETAPILGAADLVLAHHLGDWVRNLPAVH